jgi:hypothetical protein
MLLQEPEM